MQNTSAAVMLCTITALYSTGHWIGATVLILLTLLD